MYSYTIATSLFALSVAAMLILQRKRSHAWRKGLLISLLVILATWMSCSLIFFLPYAVQRFFQLSTSNWPFWGGFWKGWHLLSCLTVTGPAALSLQIGRSRNEKAILCFLSSLLLSGIIGTWYVSILPENSERTILLNQRLLIHFMEAVLLSALLGRAVDNLENRIRLGRAGIPLNLKGLADTAWRLVLAALVLVAAWYIFFILFFDRAEKRILLTLTTADRLILKPSWIGERETYRLLAEVKGPILGYLNWPASIKVFPAGSALVLVSRVQGRKHQGDGTVEQIVRDEVDERSTMEIGALLQDYEGVASSRFVIESELLETRASYLVTGLEVLEYICNEEYVDFVDSGPVWKKKPSCSVSFRPAASLVVHATGNLATELRYPYMLYAATPSDELSRERGRPAVAWNIRRSGREMVAGYGIEGDERGLRMEVLSSRSESDRGSHRVVISRVVRVDDVKLTPMSAHGVEVRNGQGEMVLGNDRSEIPPESVITLKGFFWRVEEGEEARILIRGSASSVVLNDEEWLPNVWSSMDDALKGGFIAAFGAIVGWLAHRISSGRRAAVL